jgi:hypothetical protein
MSVRWKVRVEEFARHVGPGLNGLWALIFAARSGALRLALVIPLDDDRAVTEAATDLNEALHELEWSTGAARSGETAVEFDGLSLNDVSDCRAAIAALLRAAVDVAATILDDERLDTRQVLAVTRVVNLAGSAHLHLTSRLL